MALTEKLTAIADAIREKTATADLMTLAQMPDLIASIVTGDGGETGEQSMLDAIIAGTSVDKFTNENVKVVREYAFYEWPVEKMVLKEATFVKGYAFGSSTSSTNFFVTIDLHKASDIANYALYRTAKLKTLVLRNENMTVLQGALGSKDLLSGKGYIYVPRVLVDAYKAATNWSAVADQFRALEDYTVDGTITGELDESKI